MCKYSNSFFEKKLLKNLNFIPIVSEKTIKGDYNIDLYSKLLKERIIFINGDINDELSNLIVSQLLFLESENFDKEINMYINSNGGSVSSGLAIYDVMNFIKPEIVTFCIGIAASMAAILLSSGQIGKRFSLINSRIMIHQPLGGAKGQASDIKIQSKEISCLKNVLNYILSVNTGKSLKEINKDTDRDNFMSSSEAVDYGIIDHVLINK